MAQQGERLAAALRAATTISALADLRELAVFMAGRVRLSPTFRFAEGATGLDALSRSQVTSLAQDIADGGFDGGRLWLVGFSDARGDAAENRRLARERAEAVAAALADALGGDWPEGVQVTPLAFGEVLPVACDAHPLGRALNRRVELWVDIP